MNVIKWGNSLGVRIPRVFADKIGIHEGTPIEVSLKNQNIIIRKGYSLESLLSKVTEENIHHEIQVGLSRGKEEW
jgi:antitoxin MazE